MTVSFDRQAAGFDLRTGLPAGVARRVAAAVAELAPPGGGAVLELGAGTGQIGRHLAGACPVYVGIDLSGPMLTVFRRRLAAGGRAALVRADAAAAWPVAAGRVGLVFLSRAAHLLPVRVLVEEALRVTAGEGAVVVLGGVRSDPDSLRALLRREMRRLLAEHGVEPRSSGDARRRIAGAFAERGGEPLPPRTVASWAAVHRADDALAAWRGKAGLGGRAVPPEVQDLVLRRLEAWVRELFGRLDVQRPATERYELAAIRLPRRLPSDPPGGTA